MQNSSHKSIYNLYKSCSTLHKESGKIGFTLFLFFLEFLCNLQVSGTTQRKRRILLHAGPWKDLKLHSYALGTKTFTEQPPAAEGNSPPAMWSWVWPTNGTTTQLGSPALD
jgi:hypothetical protein